MTGRLGLGLGLGLAGMLAALATIVGLAATGSAAPTVALAATVATRPAIATWGSRPTTRSCCPGAGGRPSVPLLGGPLRLARDRRTEADRIDGRAMTTVFYSNGARQIAYTIVSGRLLSPGATPVRTLNLARTELTVFSTTGGRRIVTWMRRGHTCVLSGQEVPLKALLKLATWRAHGRDSLLITPPGTDRSATDRRRSADRAAVLRWCQKG